MAILKLVGGAFRAVEDEELNEVALDDLGSAVSEAGITLVAPNTADVMSLEGKLRNVERIVLEFPKFADGRAYSQARLLRDRLGFTGEIRARGDVLCDQALFMARSGFDALDIGDGAIEGFSRALGEFRQFYQAGHFGSAPVWHQRTRRALAAE